MYEELFYVRLLICTSFIYTYFSIYCSTLLKGSLWSYKSEYEGLGRFRNPSVSEEKVGYPYGIEILGV